MRRKKIFFLHFDYGFHNIFFIVNRRFKRFLNIFKSEFVGDNAIHIDKSFGNYKLR